MRGAFEAFGEFRASLRSILRVAGIASNPGSSDAELLAMCRALVDEKVRLDKELTEAMRELYPLRGGARDLKEELEAKCTEVQRLEKVKWANAQLRAALEDLIADHAEGCDCWHHQALEGKA